MREACELMDENRESANEAVESVGTITPEVIPPSVETSVAVGKEIGKWKSDGKRSRRVSVKVEGEKSESCENSSPQEKEEESVPVRFSYPVGKVIGGVTITGKPLGTSTWVADASASGDLVAALPESVLVEARSGTSGVAVDLRKFLDDLPSAAGKFEGVKGIALATRYPVWVVTRLFSVFPVLQNVYYEAMDLAVMEVEGAAFRAAIGVKLKTERRFKKKMRDPMTGKEVEQTVEEVTEKDAPPDPTLSRLILTSRMKNRYKDNGGQKQAVVINITGAENDL